MSDSTTAGNTWEKCPHCGNYHAGRCPHVRAIEYYPDGTVKRVEFVAPGDWLPRSAPIEMPRQPWEPVWYSTATQFAPETRETYAQHLTRRRDALRA